MIKSQSSTALDSPEAIVPRPLVVLRHDRKELWVRSKQNEMDGSAVFYRVEDLVKGTVRSRALFLSVF